jgi:hypothetical protein
MTHSLAEERIASLVGHDLRAAGTGCVATHGWGAPTFSVGALDCFNLAEESMAVVLDGLQAQPGGVAMFLAGRVGDDEADHLTANVVRPGGPGKVLADHLAIFCVEFGVRMIDDPGRFPRDDRAAVDLDAVTLDRE